MLCKRPSVRLYNACVTLNMQGQSTIDVQKTLSGPNNMCIGRPRDIEFGHSKVGRPIEASIERFDLMFYERPYWDI